MSFIHPLLLSGLLLAGLPVLLHLILRQQPKRVPFPAFRFLVPKATSNRRKLRLRNWLLLLLRILMLALMCLALARPKIFSDRLNLAGDRPMVAVLVIDTSASMGYVVNGKSRLDEAKARAIELIEGLPPDQMNLVSAIWFAEWNRIENDSDLSHHERTAVETWLATLRRSVPACFCDQQYLE